MKFNPNVSSSRRKNRKAHLGAPSSVKRLLMSAPLSGDLRKKYGIRSLPIRRNDEVQVVRGGHKNKDGKVIRVYRKRNIVHIERLTRDRANGATVNIGIHPSKVQITKLELDKDRRRLIDRKVSHKDGKDKHKVSGAEVAVASQAAPAAGKSEASPMQTVD